MGEPANSPKLPKGVFVSSSLIFILGMSALLMVMLFMDDAQNNPISFPLTFLYTVCCYIVGTGVRNMKDWARWLALPILVFTLWWDFYYLFLRVLFGPGVSRDSLLYGPGTWFFGTLGLLLALNAVLAPFVVGYFLLVDKETVAAFLKQAAQSSSAAADKGSNNDKGRWGRTTGSILVWLALGAFLIYRSPPIECWAITNPPPTNYRVQSLVFDLSHISKPLCKVEPLPGVHLGASVDYVMKFLGDAGVRFVIFDREGTTPSLSAWSIEFQTMGKYPGNVGPVPVKVRIIFDSGRVDGFSMVHSFDNADGAGLATYKSIDDVLTSALGAARNLEGKPNSSGQSHGPWFRDEYYGAQVSFSQYRSSMPGEISIDILVRN